MKVTKLFVSYISYSNAKDVIIEFDTNWPLISDEIAVVRDLCAMKERVPSNIIRIVNIIPLAD